MSTDAPSLDECRRQGLSDFHYRRPRPQHVTWSAEHWHAYDQGYERAKEDDARADAEGLYDKEHADDELRRRRCIVHR